MRRLLATAAAGLVLAGSQAAATAPTLHAADRIGSSSQTANEFEGIPVIYLIGATILLVVLVVAIADDDKDNQGGENPSSP